MDRYLVLAEFRQNDVERALRALQLAGIGHVEHDPAAAQHARGDERLDESLLREIRIAPAGEQVAAVPLALAVADEHEGVGALITRDHGTDFHVQSPSTSDIE